MGRTQAVCRTLADWLLSDLRELSPEGLRSSQVAMVSLLGSTLRLAVPPRHVFSEAPAEPLDGPSDRLIVAAVSAVELAHVLRFFSIANLCQVDLFFEADCLRVRGSWTEYVLARVPQDEALRQFGMADREHVS
jgi:hypothetical protein